MALPLSMSLRWARRPRLPAPSRTEVCPPSLLQRPGSAWQGLLAWMMVPSPMGNAPPRNRLLGVRNEFIATLADIDTDAAQGVRQRVQQMHSLRDLWHARAEVFSAVAVAHSETEAGRRLAVLNRHFPTRAPRSQWAPF